MPKRKRTSAERDADLISALPDVLLHHILGLMHAREAVKTCVLSQRWRNLWKSMPVLRVTGADPVESVQEFMDHLLLLRDRSDLDACIFEFGKYRNSDVAYVNLWIRHALWCHVKELAVAVFGTGRMVNELELDELPVVSQYLTKLNLRGVILDQMFLDFSRCPALKDLNMTTCNIYASKISCRSIERLGIQDCKFLWDDCRAHISAPNLMSLQIDGFWGLTPSFEEMPALITATVKFGRGCLDSCEEHDNGYCDDASCLNRSGRDGGNPSCVLLKSLSAARHLELAVDPRRFILKRDLRWCPAFSKLNTLVLAEWCVADDYCSLICILQHTPALEILTIQLYQLLERKPNSTVPSKTVYNSMNQSYLQENLKNVYLECNNVDERVHNTLKSLITYGVPLQKIIIQQQNESSGCFSFVCTGLTSMKG